MDTKDTALLTKLRGLFAGEAEERLQAITSSLLMLERQPDAAEAAELVETLFREVHTLKGAARAVSLGEIEAISQAVETVCAGVKRKTVAVWPEFFDALYRAMDVVRQLSLDAESVSAQQVAEVLDAVSQLEVQGRARAAAQIAAPIGIEQPESQSILETILHNNQEDSQSDTTAVREPVAVAERQGLSSEETSLPRKEGQRSRRASATPRQTKEKPPRTPKKKIAAQQLRVAIDEPEHVRRQTISLQLEQSAEGMSTGQSLEPQSGFVAAPPESEKASQTQALPVADVQLRTHIIPRAKAAKNQKSKTAAAPGETVRVEAAKLDALFLQAEEMLVVKLKTGEHAAELRGLVTMLETWKREWAKVHINVRKAQSLLEKEEHRTSAEPIYGQAALLVEFLNWTQEHFRTLDKALTTLTKGVTKDQQALGSMVDILLEDAKKVLLLPFASTLEVLPRMVRDLSRAQGKEVEFTLRGEEVEIDKRILEAIKDPLIHLLRNCIDHGLERAAERERL